MSQDTEKMKIESRPHSTVVISQPMVRDYSTGGGHLAGDTLIEGDERIVTQKWQGYPPENLNVIGQSMPPMPEVSIPRFTGTAEYATRIWFPDLLYAKFLTCPHPHARVRRLDSSRAERMPGVAHILTYQNAPATTRLPIAPGNPLGQEFGLQGEVVAIVAADTEDLAEDAVEAIEVEYEILPSVENLEQAMSADAPDLNQGAGNLMKVFENDPHYDPNATWVSNHGDVRQGFAEAAVIREFNYYFGGAVSVPMQPCGSVAKWEGEKLTFWGMSQSIYPARAGLAAALGIDAEDIRFIDKYNGCTFGAARAGSELFYPFVAHLARETGRPVKLMLPKDHELAHIQIKPELITKFRVGATSEGRIIALTHEVHVSAGDSNPGEFTGIGHASGEISKNTTELYTSEIPHWESTWYSYRTNGPRPGPSRSYTQQEVKWAWEGMMDEMAEEVGIDPLQFRLTHVSKPGDSLSPVRDWHAQELGGRYEVENGALSYDSFASVEVLEEGARAIGWDQRNPVPGGNPGRFKRGIGVAASQHHSGQMGYHEGEEGFQKQVDAGNRQVYGAEIELGADGDVIMKNALPDSGSNHDTALAQIVAEILGFTSRDRVRVVWGDTKVTPPSQEWWGGRTITLQGAAIFSAADKLRKDLLQRGADALAVDATELEIRDGVILSTEDPQVQISFGDLARVGGGFIRHTGRGISMGQGRAMSKGVGACFAEVEVDTWTGDWRFLRAAYCHDTGLVVNPLAAEADMEGSLVESMQIGTDSIPWDREFPGTRHYSVGYLSYRLPTIMDVPEQTQVFVDSLEPRWFYGVKSFSETAIGAVPGAIANAIYNACGVRIREHPITRDKIMAGLKANA